MRRSFLLCLLWVGVCALGVVFLKAGAPQPRFTRSDVLPTAVGLVAFVGGGVLLLIEVIRGIEAAADRRFRPR